MLDRIQSSTEETLIEEAYLNVKERSRETKHVPKNRPNIENPIYIEIGVDLERLFIDIIP